jgi:hypothetical protein
MKQGCRIDTTGNRRIKWRDGTVTEISAVEVREEDMVSYSSEDTMM